MNRMPALKLCQAAPGSQRGEVQSVKAPCYLSRGLRISGSQIMLLATTRSAFPAANTVLISILEIPGIRITPRGTQKAGSADVGDSARSA